LDPKAVLFVAESGGFAAEIRRIAGPEIRGKIPKPLELTKIH
jgi:hypothetical protein